MSLDSLWLLTCMVVFFDHSDPARWVRAGKSSFFSYWFLRSFSKQVEIFFSGSGNATVVFLIGHALKGNIGMKKKHIFGEYHNLDSLILSKT